VLTARRLPPILFDLLLLVLTVRRAPDWRHQRLPRLLVRDGAWAFAVVFGQCALPPPSAACAEPRRRVRRERDLLSGARRRARVRRVAVRGPASWACEMVLTPREGSWQHAASSFAACRLVLHMHREGEPTAAPWPRPLGDLQRTGHSQYALDTYLTGLELDSQVQ
jgi:hypothetical protein